MKILDTVELSGNKWIHLFQSTWEHLGKKGLWFFVSRKPNPFEPQARTYDAVVVVPILTHVHRSLTGDFTPVAGSYKEYCRLEEPRLIVTSEFRIPLNDYEYGFVAGLPDGKETPEETATRELKEETGLELTNVYKVSPPIYSSGGLIDESVVMVFCLCRAPENFKPALEASEDIHLHLLTHKELRDLMKKPLKFAGKAWPALYMFDLLSFDASVSLPSSQVQGLPSL